MSADRENLFRQDLVHFAKQLAVAGLSVGKSGNLSARCDDLVLITPTGVSYEELAADDIVAIDLAGTPRREQRYKPSSEWPFHCQLYRSRSDVQAIVHAHAPACTALACTGRNIPAFHYMVAIAGGREIPIADYAVFGSEALSNNLLTAIGALNACLLANHGMIAVGNNIAGAFQLAIEVEALAQQYCQALQIGGVKLLSEREMEEVLVKFQHYGQRT